MPRAEGERPRNSIIQTLGEKLGIFPTRQEINRRAIHKTFIGDYETLDKLRDQAETDFDRAKMEAILHSSACTGKRLFLAGITEIDPHPTEQVEYSPQFPFPMPNTEDPDNYNIVVFPKAKRRL